MGSVVRASRLSALDRVLGFVFGAARGVLIVILVALMITTIIPEQSKEGMFKDSKYFKLASDGAEPVKNMIPDNWVESFKAKTEEFVLLKGDKAKVDKEEKVEAKVEEVDETKEEVKELTLGEKLKQAADAVDNLQSLKKDGEELFNQLAQPKTVGDEGTTVEDDLSSDLDMLLDVLEDRVVTTDEKTPELKSESQEIMKSVKDKVEKE